MAIPAGYTLAPSGFFYYTDGSGPYTVSQAGVATLIGTGAGGGAFVTNSSGTYAARPAASSVNMGSLYYATDTGEVYSSNGTVWAAQPSGGTEVGYVESTTPFTTTSGSAVAVTGMTITVTAGERPLVLSSGGLASNVTALGRCRVEIRQGTSTIIAIMNGGFYDTNITFPSVSAQRSVRNLTPGTDYTFNLYCVCSNGIGTANMYSDTETRWFLRAETS